MLASNWQTRPLLSSHAAPAPSVGAQERGASPAAAWVQEAPGGGESRGGFSEAEEGQPDAWVRFVGTELEGAGQMGTLMRLAARPRPRGAAAVLAASLVRARESVLEVEHVYTGARTNRTPRGRSEA